MRTIASLVPFVRALAGCGGTISVAFFTGPQQRYVTTAALALPPELDDGSGRVASVPCGPSGMCPSPSGAIVLTCEASVCDPAPTTLSVQVGEVVDVEALLRETRDIGVRRIESYTIEEVGYEVTLNTLGLDVGPVDIYWAPEAATAIDPALGVRRFGTVPLVANGTTPRGQIDIDEAGATALSDYLVATGSRVRFWAQTVIDLDPGDPYPAGGTLSVGVNVTITAVGRVID
jgi:hypothetical protein